MNFNIGFIPIEPYVEFDKIINGKRVYSIKFQFILETATYIEKLIIQKMKERKSISIDNLGIQLGLSLEHIEGTRFSLPKPIKLKDKRIEVHNLSFYL